MSDLIYLIGFSGTGKTSVGKLVADSLNWEYIDIDKIIELEQKKKISQIFEENGEPYFRKLESKAIVATQELQGCVISCGGGIFESRENRAQLLSNGLVVCLKADAATIEHRLNRHLQGSPATVSRPVFRDAIEQNSLEELLALRQPNYSLAHWHIQTDYLSLVEVAAQVISAWKNLKKKIGFTKISNSIYPANLIMARTDSKEYPIHVGWGILDTELGELLRSITDRKVIYLISDNQVYSFYGERFIKVAEKAGYEVRDFRIPVGESSKSLPMVAAIYEWLADHKVERGDLIVAFGGGVVGDLVGFVAATYLRGIKLIQIPSSLIAMVDSSIGGKTAINLKQGKNLAGAFYQPEAVLVDTQLLTSLDCRCLTEGWAEAIKYGLITDSSLFSLFEKETLNLSKLESGITTNVVETCIRIKVGIVGQDERDVLGRRALLNYGHTIGHGLEAATCYTTFLHGEAVSIGMMGAARIGYSLGITPQVVIERQEKLLTSLGLPVSAKGVDWLEVLDGMSRDKKTVKGQVSWVLINDIGESQVYNGVSSELVKQVVADLCSPTSV